jgi:hypothetical protein
MSHELVSSQVSPDVVETLETLLLGARQGHIVGIAFGAVLTRGRYMTNWAGTVHKRPTHALGMIHVLATQIEDLIHQRDPDDTR